MFILSIHFWFISLILLSFIILLLPFHLLLKNYLIYVSLMSTHSFDCVIFSFTFLNLLLSSIVNISPSFSLFISRPPWDYFFFYVSYLNFFVCFGAFFPYISQFFSFVFLYLPVLNHHSWIISFPYLFQFCLFYAVLLFLLSSFILFLYLFCLFICILNYFSLFQFYIKNFLIFHLLLFIPCHFIFSFFYQVLSYSIPLILFNFIPHLFLHKLSNLNKQQTIHHI